MHKHSVNDFKKLDPETLDPQLASDLIGILTSDGEILNHYEDGTTYDSFREAAVGFLSSLPESTWVKIPEYINIPYEISDDQYDDIIKPEKLRIYADIQVLRDMS